MLKTIIIEDELASQEFLASIVSEYCPRCELCGVAEDFDNAIKLIQEVNPDLVFMDIELKDTNAFEILGHLEKTNFKIIFTTAYQQHALKAFDYQAIDYILKPYSPKDVVKAVERIRDQDLNMDVVSMIEGVLRNPIVKNESRFSNRTADGISFFEIKEIVRIEADGPYCTLHLSSGEHCLISKPLRTVEEELPEHLFFRTHDSHLINLNYVKHYKRDEGGYTLLSDNTKIPVSRRKKNDLIQMLSNI